MFGAVISNYACLSEFENHRKSSKEDMCSFLSPNNIHRNGDVNFFGMDNSNFNQNKIK